AELTDKQREQLATLTRQHDAVRQEWRHHYEGKLVWEANSRLDAMAHFFEECAQDPKLCARVYLPEVLRRTTVAEILPALEALTTDITDIKRKAQRTDARLRRVIQPATFVWSSALQPAYPQADFWWMYARPPQA
ncbi:MAG: hypothetical protein H7Y11_08305, partial [Armatimonadetes bacterium]|nr:hypothetical protein [Anaerolineae bacterium]